jgi:hypothetical protein
MAAFGGRTDFALVAGQCRLLPKGEVAGYSMTSSASASIVGGMSRPALAVASGHQDVAFRQQLQQM